MGTTVKILLGCTGILVIALILAVYFMPAKNPSRSFVPYRYGAPAPRIK